MDFVDEDRLTSIGRRTGATLGCAARYLRRSGRFVREHKATVAIALVAGFIFGSAIRRI